MGHHGMLAELNLAQLGAALLHDVTTSMTYIPGDAGKGL